MLAFLMLILLHASIWECSIGLVTSRHQCDVPLAGDLDVPLMSGQASRGRFKLAGLGFGLPMARLFAKYFGGDFQLVNLPSYGCDVYISLRNLDPWDWEEDHGTQVAEGHYLDHQHHEG
jgi:hypothetical protein